MTTDNPFKGSSMISPSNIIVFKFTRSLFDFVMVTELEEIAAVNHTTLLLMKKRHVNVQRCVGRKVKQIKDDAFIPIVLSK
jgi:hypothetical protein